MSNLIEELKKEMGYIELSPKRGNCLFCIERENKYVDRMWEFVCTHNNLVEFEVKSDASCKLFKEK